ncbi:Bug family tripartite tricarboxylate transporter substrate binding protein [Thermodesulfobacteriota bacterium]
MGRRLLGSMLALALFIVLSAWALPGEAADNPADFYKGKIIKILCSERPGGGTDSLARIVAPYLAKYTGASTVAVENKPQGTGLVARNFIYHNAKKDGLTVGFYSGGSTVYNYLTDFPSVKYDLMGTPWIANFLFQRWYCLAGANSPYNSIKDLKSAKGLKFGGASRGGTLSIASALIMYLFDLDGKLVTGFKGTKGVALAMRRGELDGASGQTSNVIRNIEQGHVKPILTLDYKRDKAFPDVPTVGEVTKLTGAKKELFDSFLLVPDTKMVCVPPGTPEDRVKFLRDAVGKMMKDPELIKKLKKRTGIDVEWFSNEETMGFLKQALEKKKKGVFKDLMDIVEKLRH